MLPVQIHLSHFNLASLIHLPVVLFAGCLSYLRTFGKYVPCSTLARAPLELELLQ